MTLNACVLVILWINELAEHDILVVVRVLLNDLAVYLRHYFTQLLLSEDLLEVQFHQL